MSNLQLCFIAAPYSAKTDEQRRVNQCRARAVGMLARHMGLVPIVPHIIGASGLFGASVNDDGSDTEARREALACCKALLLRCDLLWVVKDENDRFSDGVLDEMVAWGFKTGPDAEQTSTRRTWDAWEMVIRAAGLVDGVLADRCVCWPTGKSIWHDGESVCPRCNGSRFVSIVNVRT